MNLDKTKVTVFRKWRAAHEKWFINGQRLEVGNSYVYMGYMLTTKLSVSTSLEPTTLKAKTK